LFVFPSFLHSSFISQVMNTRSIFVIFALFACVSVFANAQGTEELKAFAQWLANNKALSRTNLGIFEGLRFGGLAGTDIKTGESLFRIPLSVVITKETVAKEPWAAYQGWSFDREPLMVWLINELANKESFWAPYLSTLPTDFSSFPIFWSEEDLAELQASSLRETIVSSKKLLEQTFARLSKNLIQANPTLFPNGLTYEQYIWAYCVVSSRAWTFGNNFVLVPLGDLLNHRPDAGFPGVDVSGQYLEVNATQDYIKGDQVFMSYGNKSNSELLGTYGFILEDNPHEAAIINFQLRPSNLAIAIIEPLLKKADPAYGTLRLVPNYRPDGLLRAFRIANIDFDDLKHTAALLEGRPISLKNEVLAYRGAIAALSNLFKAFTTTVEEDTTLLESGNLSPNRRAAVLIRRSDKKIIQNIVLVLAKLWENILIDGTLPGGVAYN